MKIQLCLIQKYKYIRYNQTILYFITHILLNSKRRSTFERFLLCLNGRTALLTFSRTPTSLLQQELPLQKHEGIYKFIG